MAQTSRNPSSSSVAAADDRGYVDWPAIFVGAVLASGIAVVLLGFGTTIGLTLHSLEEGQAPGMGTIIGIGLWSIWAIVSSHMVGGYVAGRLRRRAFGATEHEADIRDGLHGLAVWALGVLLGAALVASGLTAGAWVGAKASEAAATVLDTEDASPQRYIADLLLRSQGDRRADGAQAEMAREEVVRILQASVTEDTVPEPDRAYLAVLVEQQSGLSGDEARQRVDAGLNRFQALKQEAQETLEVARKATVVSAFVLAASLFIAAAGAWWASSMGGRHRDEQTVFPLFGRRY